jgi:hypothetical protein
MVGIIRSEVIYLLFYNGIYHGWWNLASKDQTDAESCVSRMLVRRYFVSYVLANCYIYIFWGCYNPLLVHRRWGIMMENHLFFLNVDDYDPCRKNWHWIMGMFICFFFRIHVQSFGGILMFIILYPCWIQTARIFF